MEVVPRQRVAPVPRELRSRSARSGVRVNVGRPETKALALHKARHGVTPGLRKTVRLLTTVRRTTVSSHQEQLNSVRTSGRGSNNVAVISKLGYFRSLYVASVGTWLLVCEYTRMICFRAVITRG